MITLALAGDTMLGRKVGERLADAPAAPLFDAGVREALATADLVLVNLECCISDRGERWPDPDKPFFFRAPPVAAQVLAGLGVDVVTLANNHALDYGPTALTDTCAHLEDVGIRWVGAGRDRDAARRPVTIEVNGLRVGIVGASDHPLDFAAGARRRGIAWWDPAMPDWVEETVGGLAVEVDAVVATPHWGPNMTSTPGSRIRAAASRLVAAGAALVAGHSAHVFHGVTWDGAGTPPVLFDLGDFIDDYAVDPVLRNDLGLVWFVRFDGARVAAIEALPIALDYCFTRVADSAEHRWIRRRLTAACAELGTMVEDRDGRLGILPAA
jgi:poly-gamma-glutamate capsule biosynthesis protein CapA/YwtB (metallophosphatase superfamily)